MLKAIVFHMVRWGIALAAGYLIKRGLLAGNEQDAFVGACMGLVPFVWGIASHARTQGVIEDQQTHIALLNNNADIVGDQALKGLT